MKKSQFDFTHVLKHPLAGCLVLGEDGYGQMAIPEKPSDWTPICRRNWKGRRITFISHRENERLAIYQTQDGLQHAVVFSCPVAYWDNHTLRAIDTRLTEVRDRERLSQGHAYTALGPPIRSLFSPDYGKGTGHSDGGELTCEWGTDEGVKVELTDKEAFRENVRTMAVYSGAFDAAGGDLTAYPSLLGITNEILFTGSPTDKLTLWFQLETAGAEMEKDEGGGVRLVRRSSDGESPFWG